MFSVLIAAALAQAVSGVPSGWKTYEKPAYGFSSCIPTSAKPVTYARADSSINHYSVGSSEIKFEHVRANPKRSYTPTAFLHNHEDQYDNKITNVVNGPNFVMHNGSDAYGLFWSAVIKHRGGYSYIYLGSFNDANKLADAVSKVGACVKTN